MCLKMSREILFKAKRLDNGEWIEGWFSLMFLDGSGILNVIYTGKFDEWVEIDIKTLSQYIGLVDMSDKKIFENDIVFDRDYNDFYRVYFDEDGLQFLFYSDELEESLCPDDLDVLELIGSSFDKKVIENWAKAQTKAYINSKDKVG